MDTLSQLQSLGLELPSPAYLLGAVLFGIVGYVAYRRGKTKKVSGLYWCGWVLMLYPYLISDTWLLWGVGGALTAWVLRTWE